MNPMNPEQAIRVGFDDQIFVAQTRGGISKYFVEIIQRLPDYGVEPVVVTRGTRNRHLAESNLIRELPSDGRTKGIVRGIIWRVTGWFSTSLPTKPLHLDLMHHTFTMGPYLSRWRGKRVVTIFDMTPELFPSYFKLGNPHFAKRRYCEVSDAVISISQSTTEDMLRFYGGYLKEKTVQIPFGVSESFLAKIGKDEPLGFTLPSRYLLYVGVRRGYKRFDLALSAFVTIAQSDADIFLVVVGGGAFSSAESASIAATGLASRVRWLAPSDNEIREVYRRAEVFLFPSEYEGFGLPTLEALASGAPTVLADASCSREVGGNVALYFAPGDVEDLVQKTREAMTNKIKKRTLELGPARARTFTWDRVAKMTAALYRDVLERN